MKAASHELHVCTDDGSYGHHGFVTEVLKQMLEKEDVKLVVGIGPVPMMKFVSKMTAEYRVKTLVSLNAVMVDGTGMCGCCRVSRGRQNPVCVRGRARVRRSPGGFRRVVAAASVLQGGGRARVRDVPEEELHVRPVAPSVAVEEIPWLRKK